VERVINSGVDLQPRYERLYCCACGNFYPAEGYVHIISYRRREWYTYFCKLDLQSFIHSFIQHTPVLVNGCRFPISTPRGSLRHEARTAHFRISVL
jgi:hypothetical protein